MPPPKLVEKPDRIPKAPLDVAKLDPAAKKKWTDALRSGDYTQARYALYESADNSHCCIAVGFAVLCPDRHVEDEDTSSCADAIGIDIDTERALVAANDDYNFDFAAIADWIDESL